MLIFNRIGRCYGLCGGLPTGKIFPVPCNSAAVLAQFCEREACLELSHSQMRHSHALCAVPCGRWPRSRWLLRLLSRPSRASTAVFSLRSRRSILSHRLRIRLSQNPCWIASRDAVISNWAINHTAGANDTVFPYVRHYHTVRAKPAVGADLDW